ncbi:MAG: S8 family serine peptidase [Butyrivibrio sp.]|nr:S8 family serine peptidase [Butyrivibrio sp.]
MKKNLMYKHVLSVTLSLSIVFSQIITILATPSAAQTESEDSSFSDGVKLIDEDLNELGVEIDNEKEKIDDEEKDPDEEVRVIIVMEGDSVLDKGYDTVEIADSSDAIREVDKIESEQEKTVDKISEEALDGNELKVNYSFSIITNAISANVALKDIAAIEQVDGVEAVYTAVQHDPVEVTDPATITSGEMVGSYQTWISGYTGAGQRIAVIDTGIDAGHPSFDGSAFMAHLKETAEDSSKEIAEYDLLAENEIENVLPHLNAFKDDEDVTADDLYQSEKIPFAFNYVDKDMDISHDNDDSGDHGTHVSGIATANYYVPNADVEGGFAPQAQGVVGIAPDAQLLSMKVFGKNGGAFTDDYMAAIEDAILLKVDTINMSLGSGEAGNTRSSEEYVNDIFDKLQGTSTVISVSAGNSSFWSTKSLYGANLSGNVNLDTIGTPGSYDKAFTVASAVNSGITSCYFVFDNDKKVFYQNAKNTTAPKFNTLDKSTGEQGTEYEYVYLDSIGTSGEYENIDVKGKIVFVSRGVISFSEKQINAQEAGAVAVVIYNNSAGLITMTMGGNEAQIPACSITLAEAEAIKKSSTEKGDGVYEGKITVYTIPETRHHAADGYTMSDFSSFGVPDSLDLKPEITAPGSNVYSTTNGGKYGLESGTSMAAPSISGQTALVQQYVKENNLAEKNDISVRTLSQSLLMSTAMPLKEGNNQDNPEYTPRVQGAGLANVQDAISSPAYILLGDKAESDGKVKAVLGDDPEKTGCYEFSFDIYNMDVDPQYYTLDSSVLTEELMHAGEIGVIAGKSHRLSPSVELTADDSKLVYDLNDDGKVNAKDRKVLLQYVNGSRDIPLVKKNDEYYDFNNDGVISTKDVYLFSRQLKGKAEVADLGLSVVEVKDSTKVNVKISLSAEDRHYLEGYENGMFVDGYVYVKGAVPMSVPFLAFYGSWMDSPMFEDYDYMKVVYDDDYARNVLTYSGVEKTNWLSICTLGESEENFYIPNKYVAEAEYIADRNALSSENGTYLVKQYFSLIRNTGRLILTIRDVDTGEKYFEQIERNVESEFFYAKTNRWEQTRGAFELNWAGTDADGNPLPDGTKVEVVLQAIPSYYNDVEDVSELKADGMYIRTPFVIDNEKPTIIGTGKTDDDKLRIKIHDNRYAATILLLNKDADVVGKFAVNQTKPGCDVEVDVDCEEEFSYIAVVDYADNSSVYEYNSSAITSDAENSASDMSSASASTDISDDAASAEKSDDVAKDSSSDEASEEISGEAEAAKVSDVQKAEDLASDEATEGIADDEDEAGEKNDD